MSNTYMIDTLYNLIQKNEYNKELISNMKNGKLTRNTNKKIEEYNILIRKNLYDQIRIITEIYYYNYEYNNNLFNNFKILEELKNNLIKNEYISNPITDEEKLIIKAFKDELSRFNKPKVEPKTITQICNKYDPKLLEMGEKDIRILNDFIPTNIQCICNYIHTDLKPNFIEINILLIISNYLLNNPKLNLYRDFIFNCPKKFLITYMNNSETTPTILIKLSNSYMFDIIDFLLEYIHDSKIKTWYERYGEKFLFKKYIKKI